MPYDKIKFYYLKEKIEEKKNQNRFRNSMKCFTSVEIYRTRSTLLLL